ncbi:hypothetical protein DB771_20940 [Burkholderia sp. AU29985]|nr:hypothetical protein EGY28_08095 [Burkholderia dolosa]PRE49884.1 hypothetical protein C6P87_13010 [Burkholderia sp. AU12872]PUA74778.1 hypothetical protein DB771_20940 [Burkholderia sp. AU29985]
MRAQRPAAAQCAIDHIRRHPTGGYARAVRVRARQRDRDERRAGRCARVIRQSTPRRISSYRALKPSRPQQSFRDAYATVVSV